MPRHSAPICKPLQLAALEMFQQVGYDATTAAQIAAKAGVTERTFFRHFPDKREVLFDGEGQLADGIKRSIKATAPAGGPWRTLFLAFRSMEPLFVENREFSEPRRRIIAGNAALEERQQTKVRFLVNSITAALVERGVSSSTAGLAAELGMAALGHAFASWLEKPGRLSTHLERAFAEAGKLTNAEALDPLITGKP